LARLIASSIFSYGYTQTTGQVCVSVQRVFAHKTIASKLADGLADIASKFVVGDPVKSDTEVGPLIRHAETDRIEQWVNEGVASGAELICGGKRISDSCYACTVLYNPSEDAKVSQLEMTGGLRVPV